MTPLFRLRRSNQWLHVMLVAIAALVLSLGASPVLAQSIQTVDPNAAIDSDIVEQPGDPSVYADSGASVVDAAQNLKHTAIDSARHSAEEAVGSTAGAVSGAAQSAQSQVGEWNIEANDVAHDWSDPGMQDHGSHNYDAAPPAITTGGDTYREDDLIGAARGLFGKGSKGIAQMIQGLLAKQGEPNGYIVGREAGGAFVVGARYGSGTLYHKVEGQRPVYWTGPSVGFDFGANAGNTFVLVYNLHDTEELYSRFPGAEGQAYAVGGLNASYLRKGDKVLIPIRVGAGLRLGVNAGYMKFSKKQRWLPF